jgi:Flp pilus assembly protein TadD
MRLTARIQNVPKILFTSFLVASVWPVAVSAAAESASTLLQQGERAAVEGRCEEALGLLDQARAADPGNARAALITGQCQIRLQRYQAAEKTLEQAKQMEGALPEVDMYLGMARYHQDDLAGADPTRPA